MPNILKNASNLGSLTEYNGQSVKTSMEIIIIINSTKLLITINRK